MVSNEQDVGLLRISAGFGGIWFGGNTLDHPLTTEMVVVQVQLAQSTQVAQLFRNTPWKELTNRENRVGEYQ